MRLAACVSAIAIVGALGVVVRAQERPAPKKERPKFEVASLKPAAPGQQGGIIRPMPGNAAYKGTNITLKLMMTIAYSVPERQITGGPGWIDTDRFDLDAKAEKPGSTDDLHDMLADLLEERFKLKVRREHREQAVWHLVADPRGTKLVPHDPSDINYPPIRQLPSGLVAQNVKMDYFAFFMSRFVDRKVIDKTGLTGRYDFTIQAEPPPPPPTGEPAVREAPDIPRLLREQLGLRLENARGPVEYMVIEKVEKLTEN